MANLSVDTNHEENHDQVVTFHIDKEMFAFGIFEVKEIIRVPEITIVPKSPYFIEGVINLRGTVIPIVDLRKRFKLPPLQNKNRIRIVIVELETSLVGFLVDMVLGIRKINRELVQKPSAIMNTIDSECTKGVARTEDAIIMLLDIDKILHDEIERG
ncbi:chemotaxis protein CheW [Candidatus Uabimicrobium amorphum]|uniref:Chemotaxis protein CheW n=1 Tax=Uabimicrobium amorphum TaxID=2596890 RepID=A0A5S9II64_UABAM|nr:chemotaxis protein CheW [Candidatus Uabimicrobium amorphum]BBM82243.1 chemotaxis protein CheW [Candidatus Uabimicrobium amorphum]